MKIRTEIEYEYTVDPEKLKESYPVEYAEFVRDLGEEATDVEWVRECFEESGVVGTHGDGLFERSHYDVIYVNVAS